jgi:membrane protein required for colicin V production
MQGADYLIAAILVISGLMGLFRGFIREFVALFAWLVGLWAAWHFAFVVNPYLGGALAEPGVREWAGRVIVFVGCLLLGAAIGTLVAWFAHTAAGLALTDRLLGLLFGLLRGIVIVGLLTIAGQALRLDGEPWWKKSRAMPYAVTAGDLLERYAEPRVSPLLEDTLDKVRS